MRGFDYFPSHRQPMAGLEPAMITKKKRRPEGRRFDE
jgi:hypothetical protein